MAHQCLDQVLKAATAIVEYKNGNASSGRILASCDISFVSDKREHENFRVSLLSEYTFKLEQKIYILFSKIRFYKSTLFNDVTRDSIANNFVIDFYFRHAYRFYTKLQYAIRTKVNTKMIKNTLV